MSTEFLYDIFICHATEDKDSFVKPLAEELEHQGLAVWYDEFTLSIGDRLGESIDRGLRLSRYGVVILSPHFFKKRWTRSELYGMLARETSLNELLILPVWHGISAAEVAQYSPLMAERVAISTSLGIGNVVSAIVNRIRPESPLRIHGRQLRVAIAVVTNTKNFLLVKRCRPEGSLCWQFPAGVVKALETDADAAIRTVKEETDVVCRINRKIGARVHPETATDLTYWLCDYVNGEARVLDATENSEVTWMSGDGARRSITSHIFSPLYQILVSE